MLNFLVAVLSYTKMTHIRRQYKTLIVIVSLSVLFASNVDAFAEQVSRVSPKIILGDVYAESKIPTQIPFRVTAVDSSNNPIPVECDKTQNSIFKTGKTTVRCVAIDSFGNEARGSFVVTVGYEIVQIPDWLKSTTQFWIDNTMSDGEYAHTMNYLLDKQIIHMPHTKASKNSTGSDIPVWIKENAKKWVKGGMSDDEFAIGIQWIIKNARA
jgi:hypothetical protein